MQVYVVLKSGLYAMAINGQVEVAERTAVVAVCSSREAADEVLRVGTGAQGDWRGVTATWVDTAVVDALPLWG